MRNQKSMLIFGIILAVALMIGHPLLSIDARARGELGGAFADRLALAPGSLYAASGGSGSGEADASGGARSETFNGPNGNGANTNRNINRNANGPGGHSSTSSETLSGSNGNGVNINRNINRNENVDVHGKWPVIAGVCASHSFCAEDPLLWYNGKTGTGKSPVKKLYRNFIGSDQVNILNYKVKVCGMSHCEGLKHCFRSEKSAFKAGW